MNFSRLAIITLALNLGTSITAIIAWVIAISDQSVSTMDIAGLLGLIAFSLMWVHFVSDAIRDIWLPHESAGEQYGITRWIVLFAILLHPSLIVLYLHQNNYGLPPGSYSAYLGDAKASFVFFGIFAFTIFLAFECKKWLVQYNLWRFVLHANFLAMFAVLIHGFRLGNVMETTWYFALWCAYGLSLVAIAVWWYMRYYKTMNIRKTIAVVVVIALGVAATITALQLMPGAKDTHTTKTGPGTPSQATPQVTKTITAAELTASDGKKGSKCWLAIEGTVYDVSDNPEWVNGQHVPSRGMASCGRDLTEVISQSPHGKSVLGDLPVIGKLQ